jgi:hypothetical protein
LLEIPGNLQVSGSDLIHGGIFRDASGQEARHQGESSDRALLNAPEEFDAVLGELPEGVTVQNDMRGNARLDVVLFFVDSRNELAKRFPTVAGRLTPAGGLWISWPKRASGVTTDLTEDLVRASLEAGLVDNKVCAVDETWSSLRFVVRLKDRAVTS